MHHPPPRLPIVAEAVRALKAELDDPYSAVITGIHTFHGGQGVCGHVNAKNAYGGYVGVRTWVYMAGVAYVVPQLDPGTVVTGEDGKPDPVATEVSKACP